jgi:hypothetical protein
MNLDWTKGLWHWEFCPATGAKAEKGKSGGELAAVQALCAGRRSQVVVSASAVASAPLSVTPSKRKHFESADMSAHYTIRNPNSALQRAYGAHQQ